MLELRNITKRFGNVLANDSVSVRVEPGTIHAIVGENGAGKSTAMKIAYGFYTADSGEILVAGQPRQIDSPHDAIALGIGMVHQHFMLVEPMTVAENVVLGIEPGSPWKLDMPGAVAKIRALSQQLGMAIDPTAKIETLAVGQQQRVELLKALYREAKLLILDEPTAVLSPQAVGELFTILRQMREQGKTVVIVTHKLSEVLAISDEVTVMRDGKVVGNRKTAETSAAELARLMVGRDVLLRVEKPPAKPIGAVLAVSGLTLVDEDGHRRLDDVSFDVRAGEIVGVAGIEGNGQTELIEALAGLVDAGEVTGSVRLLDQEVGSLDARARRHRGIAHVPEDRHRRGLLLDFDLAENCILGAADRPPVAVGPARAWLSRPAIHGRCTRILNEHDVRPPDRTLPARSLSGGNQQKLVMGRELTDGPKLLLVAQPTRGVDIGGIEFIHRRLVEMRDKGCAILLVSSELEEVTALADRLLVIRDGKIVGEVDPAQTSNEQIGLMMTGGAAA
ncbi:MAG TPA: ABC transporter ATP-binding protein [Thermoanaerobaculia bacterium]|jgi:simple sugar transport system ATP-binding protein|nr:ABC transporter ATP-binding protein [Thermoanaerobaculia bacterium]